MKAVRLFAMMLCVVGFMFLTACSGSNQTSNNNDTGQKSEPSENKNKNSGKEKQIFIGITNAPASLNPINTTDVASNYIASIMFEPLVELDESMEFVNRLAESIETTDNQTYVVKLKQNVKWTDGEPFNADDVLFTFQTIGNPSVVTSLTSWTPLLEGFDSEGKLPEGQTDISGVKMVDEYTVEFRTKTPIDQNLFFEQIGKNIRYIPEHVLKDKNLENLHQDPFMQKLNVSTGAYKLVQYAKDQYVELEANADYHEGAPKINKLYFKIMPSANIVAQLQSGEIDMNVPGIGNIAVQDFDKVKEIPNVITKSGQPTNYQMMFFNTETFQDVKVRQALAYATNREMMVESLLKGEGEVIDLPFTSLHPYYVDQFGLYEYNPEKAKQLLEEANWDHNTQISIQVPTGNKTREQVGDILVENLKDVGFNAKVDKYDMPTHIQRGLAGEFDIFFLGLTFELDPNSINSYFSSQSNWNLSKYHNSEMDDLLQQGREETDPTKRKEIYTRIQEIIHEDLPQLSFFADYRMLAVNERVKVGGPKEIGMFINVHEWDVE